MITKKIEYTKDFELTKDTLYLALMDELWVSNSIDLAKYDGDISRMLYVMCKYYFLT